MRLALVISSDYAENTVVPKRAAFRDTSTHFADRIGLTDAGFDVRVLEASRELPENLEQLLKDQLGRIESLLVYFAGYVAVKADRGPALLLDGSRLRAFPLSRLRAAIEEGAQQSLVIIDGLSVVDAEQPPAEVSKTVCEALASPDGSVTSLVGIEDEWPTERRGVHRLTDLFTLALGHLARKSLGGLVTSGSVYQCMQGDVLSFASILGLEHRSGYFDFVLLQGPGVGGVSELAFGPERTTQPVPVFQPEVPTTRSALPSLPGSSPGQEAPSDPKAMLNLPALDSNLTAALSPPRASVSLPAPDRAAFARSALDTASQRPTAEDGSTPVAEDASAAPAELYSGTKARTPGSAPDETHSSFASDPHADQQARDAARGGDQDAARDADRAHEEVAPEEVGEEQAENDTSPATPRLVQNSSAERRASSPPAPEPPPDSERILPPSIAVDRKLTRTPEGRSPTLAETPHARLGQRDWLQEAAYFPSAPPPRVAPVKPVPMRHPQATLPGLNDDPTGEAEPSAPEPSEDRALPSRPPSSHRQSRPAFVPPDPDTAANSQAVIGLYEELLENLDSSEDPRRAEVHTKLGDALRDTQRRAEALFAYERALDIDPHQEQAFDGACSIYRDDRDFAGLVSTIRRKLLASNDENMRLSLLDLITHVWRIEARDLGRAVETLEERLELTPDDTDCLEQLIEVRDQQGDLFGRLESRERLARLSSADPELRAALFVEAATIAHDEIDDLARTFIHLESALELGVRQRETLEAAEALLGGRERWLEVIELYERALEVVPEGELATFVAQRLVQLVLEQSSQDALKPDTIATLIRLAACDRALSQPVGQLILAQTPGPETADLLQSLRAASPRDPKLLHRLFELSFHEHADVAANIASLLVAENAPVNEQEQELANWLVTDSLSVPQRALENADYDALVFPAEFDRDMTLSLDKLDSALILADVWVLKNSVALPKDAPVLDPETSTVTLARSFLWTSRLLSVAIPELAIVADAPSPLKLVLTENRPRVIVSKSLGSGFSLSELAYLAARHSALLLPGFAIRDHSADPRMLASALWVMAAIGNGGSKALKGLGEYEQKLGKRLLSQLEKHQALMDEVTRLVGGTNPTQAECEDRALRWLRAVDQIRLRIALLACGSPAVALKLNRAYPMDGAFTPDEQLDILAAYAGSPEHCELRSRLGIAQHYE